MQFQKESVLYSHEIRREGGEDVLYVNYLGALFVPSLSEYPDVMARTIDALIENPNVSRIVFVQQKNYNYDFKETSYLLELANLYVYLIKQEKILSQEKLSYGNHELFTKRYNDIFSFLFLLKQDPISSYHELKRIIIEAKIQMEKSESKGSRHSSYVFYLEKILSILEKTRLIHDSLDYLANYKKGEREI